MDDLLFSVYIKRRKLHPIFPFDRSGEIPLSLLGLYAREEDRFQQLIKDSKSHPEMV